MYVQGLWLCDDTSGASKLHWGVLHGTLLTQQSGAQPSCDATATALTVTHTDMVLVSKSARLVQVAHTFVSTNEAASAEDEKQELAKAQAALPRGATAVASQTANRPLWW